MKNYNKYYRLACSYVHNDADAGDIVQNGAYKAILNSDKLKNISYYDSTGQSDMAFTKPYSERTAQQIDDEVRALIAKARKMAEDIIDEHREGLVQLAELLLEREVVFTEDVEHIFGKRKSASAEDKLTIDN